MSISVKAVAAYLTHGKNIIITGPAGTGKTTVVESAVAELGMHSIYYHTPTLDPYASFIGIPVPQDDKTIDFYRPKGIEDAEVVILDELNRASPALMNTVFELIQFHSINGDPLPKLKAVVAMINPPTEQYQVEELDTALMDRFDIYLEAIPKIDVPYFTAKFGKEIAIAASDWWNTYWSSFRNSNVADQNKPVYLSPRRLEKMVATYLQIPSATTLKDTAPPGFKTSLSQLGNALDRAINQAKVSSLSADLLDAESLSMVDGRQLLKDKSYKAPLQKILSDPTVTKAQRDKILTTVATGINQGPSDQRGWGLDALIRDYGFAIKEMSPTHLKMCTGKGQAGKKWNFSRESDFMDRVMRLK